MAPWDQELPPRGDPVSLDKPQAPRQAAAPQPVQPVQYPPQYGINPYGAGPYSAVPPPVINYYPLPPAAPPTNTLALTAFILTLAGWLVLGPLVVFVTIPMGHIALSQIKRTGEQGRGFAVAALVIGYIIVALTVLLLVVFFGVLARIVSGS